MYRLEVFRVGVYDLKIQSAEEAERLALQIVKNSCLPGQEWSLKKLKGGSRN